LKFGAASSLPDTKAYFITTSRARKLFVNAEELRRLLVLLVEGALYWISRMYIM
jgi:hypothetical protein